VRADLAEGNMEVEIEAHRRTGGAGFAPIFVVGSPRSGTTMLAVLLDRHSRIAVPPETHFFWKFVPQVRNVWATASREELVDAALGFDRIADLALERGAVLKRFEGCDKTVANLLRVILETYASLRGAVRAGEKSPRHIECVPDIMEACPDARVIAIIRDGRDVVLSRMKQAWSSRGNPRRFGLFSMEWSDHVRLILELERKYGPDRFMVVKYESIILDPKPELERMCKFIGEEFEPRQLDPEVDSSTVPVWEEEWKGKARSTLDPARVEAWRRSGDRDQIWIMNCIMGRMLRRMGYADTGLGDCRWPKRIRFTVTRMPYTRFIRIWARLGLRLLRRLGFDTAGGMPH